MVKIGILGITGVLLAVLLKETRPGFSVFISMSVCILIFFYGIGRLEAVADALATLQKAVNLKDSYLKVLLKMAGITYLADFSASLCQDAGYSAIAGQIEFFGKISILAVSAPVMLALLETITGFLG